MPNEFFPHHGNLSKEEREHVEARLKGPMPTTAICTSTLEMGIDIGSVRSVAQIGAPPAVAALRQRLGRFVRGTLSFSKSEVMHEVCLLLFLHSYNLSCLNNTE